MLKSRIAAITIAAAAALVASAGAASAAPQHLPVLPPGPPTVTAHAVTHLADRPDGGNGTPDPYWADDTFTRDLSITETGSTGTGPATVYDFTATVKDAGAFTTIKGAETPNQGPGYAGDIIKSKVTGPMTGYADFTFTATALPSSLPNLGVASNENDHGTAPSDSTSTWYELAFPAGTTFGGTGIGDWSWTYDATVKTVTDKTVWALVREHHRWVWVKEVVPVKHTVKQQWTDASSNGGGNLAGDGNITG
jgi:hypothetical protein